MLALQEYPARRVALLKPSALGDIVHALPVLSALRRRYPQAHLAWVVNRAYEPLLRGHPDLDATIPFEKQDLHIVDFAVREGRAVVLAFNKWDLIEDRQKVLADLREKTERLLPQVRGIRAVTVSGATGEGLDRLMQAVVETDKVWNKRISTAKLKTDENRLHYPRELYVKGPEQMAELFADQQEALANTRRIADRCRVDLDFSANHAPLVGVKRRPPAAGAQPAAVGSTEWFQAVCATFELQPITSTDHDSGSAAITASPAATVISSVLPAPSAATPASASGSKRCTGTPRLDAR